MVVKLKKSVVSKGKSGAKKSLGGKKKKQVLKFHIECKNPAEDGILKTQSFVSSFLILGA